MIQAFFFSFWIIFLSLASTTFLPYLAIKGVIPDVVLVGALCMSLLASPEILFYLAFILGLFHDLHTGSLLGTHSLLFLVIGLIVQKFKKEWIGRVYIGTLVFVPLLSIFYQFFLQFVSFLQDEPRTITLNFLFFNAAYNLVFFYLFYLLLSLWIKSLSKKDYV